MSTTKNTDALVAKAVRDAELRDSDPVIDDADVPEPLNWQVILELVKPKKKVGSLFISEDAQEAERYQINSGIVRKIGPLAMTGKTNSGLDLSIDREKIRPGVSVVFQRYTGLRMEVETANGVSRTFIALSGEDFVAIPRDHSKIRYWV